LIFVVLFYIIFHAHEVSVAVTRRIRDRRVSEFDAHLRLPFFLCTYIIVWHLLMLKKRYIYILFFRYSIPRIHLQD